MYEKNTEYPEASSDDYVLRLSYCNSAINVWATEKHVVWQTLFTDHSFTLSNNVTQYNAPANFEWPSDFLVMVDAAGNETFFEYSRPEQVAEKKAQGKYIYWITGSPGAFKINISPTPTTANGFAGRTARLPYFKSATTYETGIESTVPEMTDPWFMIYWTLGLLYADDQNTVQARIMVQIAQDKLAGMRTKNEISPFTEPQQSSDIGDDGFGL